MATSGLFITFEGSEGCGKSTQIVRLAERLRSVGREVVQLREPGGTPIGEKIRDLLQYDASATSMTPEAELLLFAASRAQLVREVIWPALKRGAIVLCDRFLDSTTVYQGVARSLQESDVARVNEFAVNGTLPDLTLLLDLDAREGRRRASARKGPVDRMELEKEEFYESVRRGFLNLAQSNPDRIAVIDGSGDEKSVEYAIAKVIGERLQIPGGADGIH
jgi:dTMP kinase